MRVRFAALALGALLSGACGAPQPGAQPVASGQTAPTGAVAAPPDAAAAPAPNQEPLMSTLIGTWIYTEDPSGAIATDPIYQGSTLHFGADGKYVFQLAETSFPLEGRWEVTGQDGDSTLVRKDFGQGRVANMRVTPRADGAIEVRDGDGSAGAQLYVRQP